MAGSGGWPWRVWPCMADGAVTSRMLGSWEAPPPARSGTWLVSGEGEVDERTALSVGLTSADEHRGKEFRRWPTTLRPRAVVPPLHAPPLLGPPLGVDVGQLPPLAGCCG